MSAEAIQKQFGIENALRFEDAPGGLVRAVISTAKADGDLYTQGAHVAHWTPGGLRPVLFTSSKSLFAPGKAIRGGVPICFPWFGPHPDGGKAVQVFSGRYGPYVSDGTTNASIPRGIEPSAISLDDAVALLAARSGAAPARRRTSRRPSTRSGKKTKSSERKLAVARG
jgi:hypothetical protein